MRRKGVVYFCVRDYRKFFAWPWCVTELISLTSISEYESNLSLLIMTPFIIIETLHLTVCTQRVLLICIDWVPLETPDIINVFTLSLSSTDKFQSSVTVKPKGSHWIFFHCLCQAFDQCCLIAQLCGI